MKTLTQVKKRLEEIDKEALAINARIKPDVDRLTELQAEDRGLRKKLEWYQQQPRVSDHAVIRLLERKYGFDFEKQRDELLDDNAINAINAGASRIKRNGIVLVIKDKTIVTVHD